MTRALFRWFPLQELSTGLFFNRLTESDYDVDYVVRLCACGEAWWTWCGKTAHFNSDTAGDWELAHARCSDQCPTCHRYRAQWEIGDAQACCLGAVLSERNLYRHGLWVVYGTTESL